MDGKDEGQQKHRACDECRSRKLACSKEAEGCARCKREGITCHYSAQKPMGRPRKRPIVEISKDPEPAIVPANDSSMDLDPSLLELNNIITPGIMDFGAPKFAYPAPTDLQTQNLTASAVEYHKDIWHLGLAGMTFEGNKPGELREVQETSPFMDTPSLDADKTPSQSSQGATPPELKTQDINWTTGQNCACLANLYLALDSLHNVPNAVSAAIEIARSANKTAHDAIRCPVCSPPLINGSMDLPSSSFQNLMLLGALLPCIANFYKQILRMIEIETERATRECREMRFRIGDYGGVWGLLAHPTCDITHKYEDLTMEPSNWRLTIRALLKADVYGLDANFKEEHNLVSPESYLGLRDIVLMMEERQRLRHEQIDAMVAAGMLAPLGPDCPSAALAPGQKPTCQGIVEVAKRAVDSIVIA